MIERILENYKPLIAIPVAIVIIALLLIAFNGLNQGIDLKGGSIVDLNLETPISASELESVIKEGLDINEVKVSSINSEEASIEIGTDTDVVTLTNILQGKATISSFKSIGPVLGEEALNQVYWALAFAFLFMSITVFIIFRTFVPSMAVILAGLSNIIIAVGGMSLFSIPLSIASVGALLMLIGFSVDTDILLTTRLIKQKKGTVTERSINAIKTGLTMSITAIAAMASLYIVTVVFIPQADVLSNIAAVLIIGLTADIFITWLMNLGILRWYLEVRR
ncbi:protein translocase subunit SecF [Methanobacterium alkalithermotolerans]|uniref:Protein-export membrane protein SecF n=1 Tax=Methanobacterium alkalithermotolerans TaxID=2731220 RepID=A0A8T8K7F8_9EURY|nr:protein translocase subunit SecF [Methanobacterium alkalithermotolerans]QUH22910.1 protein translocase subunit SecF [Methanobacterium alkalithermotolerans]